MNWQNNLCKKIAKLISKRITCIRSSSFLAYCPIFVKSLLPLWNYWLWSFDSRDKKLKRFWPKNQHNEKKLLNFENWTNEEPQVLHMCSSFWLLGVETRDFSQAEKKRTACRAWQIVKMTTIFTQNKLGSNFECKKCHFVNVPSFVRELSQITFAFRGW